jgi:hypothetical protein
VVVPRSIPTITSSYLLAVVEFAESTKPIVPGSAVPRASGALREGDSTQGRWAKSLNRYSALWLLYAFRSK